MVPIVSDRGSSSSSSASAPVAAHAYAQAIRYKSYKRDQCNSFPLRKVVRARVHCGLQSAVQYPHDEPVVHEMHVKALHLGMVRVAMMPPCLLARLKESFTLPLLDVFIPCFPRRAVFVHVRRIQCNRGPHFFIRWRTNHVLRQTLGHAKLKATLHTDLHHMWTYTINALLCVGIRMRSLANWESAGGCAYVCV